jgi:anti-anti-sigma factor
VSGPGAFKPDFELSAGDGEAGAGSVITVRGELDSGTCEELVAVARSVLAGGQRALTLDLRQMSFIDSAGTRALIMIERMAAEHGASLVMTPAPDEVTELLRTSGVVGRGQFHSGATPPAASEFIERTELQLPREPHSPARARVEVRESLEGRAASELPNVVLLTSELVTNAVVHPRAVGDTPICLRVTIYEDRVRVEVEDHGEGFDRVPPAATGIEAEAERGRGLFLVDQVSDQWGSGHVQTDAGSRFRVWFEMQLGADDAAAAAG